MLVTSFWSKARAIHTLNKGSPTTPWFTVKKKKLACLEAGMAPVVEHLPRKHEVSLQTPVLPKKKKKEKKRGSTTFTH
jgi:hypothetical protein